MKYIVMDVVKNPYASGDEFDTEFDNLDEAVEYAEDSWGHLTSREKEKRKIIVLESVNPDEDAVNHWDGDYVKVFE